MNDVSVICKHCGQRVGLTNYSGEITLALHKLPNEYVACDGVVGKAELNVSQEEDIAVIAEKQKQSLYEKQLKSVREEFGVKIEIVNDEIQERFERFHRENPHIYEKIIDRARTLKQSGHQKYSMTALFEWLRHHTNTEVNHQGEQFKLTNDFRARYARKLLIEYQEEFAGFFEIRPSKKRK